VFLHLWPGMLSPTGMRPGHFAFLQCVFPEMTLPNRDQDTITPAGGHEGGKPNNLRYIVGGLIIMFLLAMAIMGLSTRVLERPGPDQGATEKAPAD
jgi:hypothetical protein